MLKMLKENKKTVKMVALVSICILVSFYIIYKLSSSIFMVITGSIILLIGLFVKDPEVAEIKDAKKTKLEQLTIFSEEVLEPSILKNDKVLAIEEEQDVKEKTVIDIENTNSYKFDEIDKKISKSKKAKA